MSWRGLFARKNTCAYSRLSTSPLQELELTVVFRRGEDGYTVAECLQLPGCMSQGRTPEEAQQNVMDAIKSCLVVRLQEVLCAGGVASADLVGIEVQETLRVKAPELELVSAGAGV